MRVLAIASDLSDFLKKETRFEGRIHSIFSEVINILTDSEELVTLISEKKSMAPMCLQVDFSGYDTSKLVSDDRVILTAGSIQIPRLRLKALFDDVPAWQPDMDTKGLIINAKLMSERLRSLRGILSEAGAPAGLLPLVRTLDRRYGMPEACMPFDIEMNSYSDFIEDIFLEIVGMLDLGHYDQVIPLLPRIIGFGPGLTPSTDDFLMGLVMTLYYHEKLSKSNDRSVERFAGDLFNAAHGRTTTVSEAMLKNASKGRIAASHRIFIRALFDIDNTEFQKATHEVLKNGSTSGTDFLLGVYTAQILLLRRNS